VKRNSKSAIYQQWRDSKSAIYQQLEWLKMLNYQQWRQFLGGFLACFERKE